MHNTQHDLTERVAAAYAAALKVFPDTSFADACLFGLFLNDPRTFNQMKPLVEEQIGRKLAITSPLQGPDIAAGYLEMGWRFGKPSTVVAFPTRQ
jgi:hypothetical protein